MLNLPFIAEALRKKDNRFLSNKRRNKFHTIDQSSLSRTKINKEDKVNHLCLVSQFGFEYKLIHGYEKFNEGKISMFNIRENYNIEYALMN